MDNSNPTLNEKLPPDKSDFTVSSFQDLNKGNCFCDDNSLRINDISCASCVAAKNVNTLNIISDVKLNSPFDLHSSESYNKDGSRFIQDFNNNSMDLDDSMPKFNDRPQVIKRKRSNDVEVDLSKFSFKNNSIPNINTQNRFSILGEIDIEEEPIASRNSNVPAKIKDNGFCPPIFLFNVNIKHLIDQLNSKKVVYKIVNTNKHKSKLYLKDATAHSEMMNLLRDKKIESYSFTPKELKRSTVVLRGLYYKTDLSDIKNELDSLVPNTVDTVSKFSTNFSRKNNFETSLFLVTLLTGKNSNEISSLRYLLNQRISWESPKANLKEVQCWRCQKWGHMSKNCNRSFRCIKCDESHAQGDCKFVSSQENLPFCVNCNQRGHPSNFRGCLEYKKYIKMKDDMKASSREKKDRAKNNVISAINSSNFVQKDKSFASLLQNDTPFISEKRKAIPSYIHDFLKIAQSLCQPKPVTLEEKIEHFMKGYKLLSRDVARNQCMSLLDEVNMAYGP